MGYLRNRLIQAVVTLYSVVTLGFVFIRMMPGSPESYLREQIRQEPSRFGIVGEPTPGKVDEVLRKKMHLPPEGPIWEKYIDYMIGAAQGDLGTSVIVEPGTPVMELIAEAAPWTIFISSVSLVYFTLAGIVFGSVMAYYEGTKFDVSMTVAMILDGAVPYYVAAILLLYFFGYNLEWFPRSGMYAPGLEPGFNLAFIGSVFHHAALPVISFIITGFGAGALGMRANAIRVLGEDYIRVAELRGLTSYTISTRYIGRNAILPMYTGIILGIGGLLSGSVIMEVIFTYRGMGQLMFDALVARDFPLMTANVIILTMLFVIGTIIADFTYALIDPRAEQSSMG